jgi:hypothetical protein
VHRNNRVGRFGNIGACIHLVGDGNDLKALEFVSAAAACAQLRRAAEAGRAG